MMKKNRIKILHILWSGGIGGTEQYLLTLANNFNYEVFEIDYCFLSSEGQLFNELKQLNKNVFCFDVRNGLDILGYFRFMKFLAIRKYDIFHLHVPNIMGMIVLSLFNNAKIIYSEHISPSFKREFMKRKKFYKLFLNKIDKLIFISMFVKESIERLIGRSIDKGQVIYNSCDVTKFNCIDNKFFTTGLKQLGFVGRLEAPKRPFLFIDIAERILENDNRYSFMIVGDGSLKNDLREYVIAKDLESKFSFLGFRRDICKILGSLDGVIFTSKEEGFGIVMIEAMFLKVPVFAFSDGGGVEEILDDMDTGVILDSYHIDKSVNKFFSVMSNANKIDDITNNAYRLATSKFSISKNISKIEDIYRASYEKR